MKNLRFKKGDIVKVNLDIEVQCGGYDDLNDMLPYFSTPGGDDYLLSGGTFEIVEDLPENTFLTLVLCKPTNMTLNEDDAFPNDRWNSLAAFYIDSLQKV